MAWIELHQGLGTHVKTRRLCKLLGIGPAQAVGHLALLWTWALDAAENGSLAKYQADDLALVCEWDGDANVFVAALERAGFLDLHHGELVIHDWEDYIGKLVEHRERYRLMASERKRKQRERVSELKGERVTQESRVGHAPVTDESRESHAHVTRDTSVSHAPVTPGHALTKPNLTKHVDTHVCSDAGTHDDPAATQPTEKPKRNSYPVDFERFWQAYPKRRRVEKPDALKAWHQTTAKYSIEQIMASLEVMKRSPDWTKQEGEFCPMPGRWLRRLDPDDVLGESHPPVDDVPEPIRNRPWVFLFKATPGSNAAIRILSMLAGWGVDIDEAQGLAAELGGPIQVADHYWALRQEVADAAPAF